MWSEFKKFIAKGNVIELAVGFILATSFAAVVKGLVEWIIMPPIGKLLGGVDFAGLYINLDSKGYASAADALAANAPGIYYGAWLNTIITFVIIAFVMFLVVQAYNRTQPKAATNVSRSIRLTSSSVTNAPPGRGPGLRGRSPRRPA